MILQKSTNKRRTVRSGWPLPPLVFTNEKILPTPTSLPETHPFSRTITTLGTQSQRIPIIYGKVQTGAAVIWEKATQNGYWLAAYLIGWGPVNSISNIKFNGTDAASLGILSTIYLGNSTTNASANSLLLANDTNWTSRLPGLAYVVCLIPPPGAVADSKEIDPHTFLVDVEGLLIPDHRLDSTLTTLYYTENVAVCRADFWTNIRYGGARLTNTIDWTTVDAAANICDFDIGGGTKRFKIGIKLGPDKNDWPSNDRLLRLHAQMWDSLSSGKYQMFVDVDQSVSTITFQDQDSGLNLSNILDGYMRDKEPEEVPNHVEFSYTDQVNSFKPGNAITEDPGIAARTITQVIPANYDTHGSPSYDQSKRLSIWAFNRTRLDKEYVYDVLYDGGVKCVPGLVVTVTDRDTDVSAQTMIVKSVEDIDELSFRITCEIFAHWIYSDTVQTGYAFAPPISASPYTALPAPSTLTVSQQVDQPQPGIFVPKLLVTFTPYAGSNAGGTWISMQVGTGSAIGYGPFPSSPIALSVPEGASQNVILKAYSVDRNTSQPGSAYISTSFTMYNPNAPEAIANLIYDNAGGLYWQAPPNRTYILPPSANWFASGYSAFTPTKVSDGDVGTLALRFSPSVIGYDPITNPSGAYIICNNTGGGTPAVNWPVITEIHVFWSDSLATSNIVPLKPRWYNPVAGTWNDFTTWDVQQVSNFKTVYILGNPSGISVGADAVGLFPNTSTPSSNVAGIAEIQLVTFNGVYPYVKGYRLTGYDLFGNLWQKDITYLPDTTNVIHTGEWTSQSFTYFPLYNATLKTGAHTLLQVQTISPTNVLSPLRFYDVVSILSPSGADTPTTLGTNSVLANDPPSVDSTQKIASTNWVHTNTLTLDSNKYVLTNINISGTTGSAPYVGLLLSGTTESYFAVTTIAGNWFTDSNVHDTIITSATSNTLRLGVGVSSAASIVQISSGGMAIGGGAPIKKVLSSAISWTPGNIAIGAVVGATVTVTGAVVGDVVAIGFTGSLNGCVIWGQVGSANTVQVWIYNSSGGAASFTGSYTLRVDVIQH